jgi:monomeric isocitrate dehydrogenase
MMAAEVVAIAGPLVPCMPAWARERCAYVRVFDLAVAERILADEFPQLDLTAQFRDAGALGERVALLFSAPDGTLLKLYSYVCGIRDAIIECADHGYVMAAVFDPFAIYPD